MKWGKGWKVEGKEHASGCVIPVPQRGFIIPPVHCLLPRFTHRQYSATVPETMTMRLECLILPLPACCQNNLIHQTISVAALLLSIIGGVDLAILATALTDEKHCAVLE
jgi:hypothetical protein